MVRYPASAARHSFICGPGTIAKDQPDKFGIHLMLVNSYMRCAKKNPRVRDPVPIAGEFTVLEVITLIPP